MRNLTDEILISVKYQRNWSKGQLIQLIKRWEKKNTAIWFDCDFESGEQWVRVFKDDYMFGLIGVGVPILFLDTFFERSNINYKSIKDVHVVMEIDFDAKAWILDLEIFEKAFPQVWHASSDSINPERMSINDFWYATV